MHEILEQINFNTVSVDQRARSLKPDGGQPCHNMTQRARQHRYAVQVAISIPVCTHLIKILNFEKLIFQTCTCSYPVEHHVTSLYYAASYRNNDTVECSAQRGLPLLLCTALHRTVHSGQYDLSALLSTSMIVQLDLAYPVLIYPDPSPSARKLLVTDLQQMPYIQYGMCV